METYENHINFTLAQFQYIKIQLETTDLSMKLWGIKPINSVVIPQSLMLRSNNNGVSRINVVKKYYIVIHGVT